MKTLPRLQKVPLLAVLVTAIALPAAIQAQSDNFNDGDDVAPVAWANYDPLGGNTFDASTFQYHLTAGPSPDPGTVGPARTASMPPDVYTDFYVSVDVVAWNNTYVQPFGLLARASEVGPGTSDGYLLGYANTGALLGPGNSYITIIRMEDEFDFNDIPGSGPGGDTLMNVDLDPAKDYRFVFIGKGTHLEGRVYELTNLTTPIAVVIGDTSGDATILTSGTNGVLAYNAFSATATPFAGPVDVTFDNYYASARCPINISDMVVKDDFNDGEDTTPVAWAHYDPISQAVGPAQNTWSFPGGNTYRLQAPTQPFDPQLGQGRVASVEPTVRADFRLAVDLVNWDDTLINQDLGIFARLSNIGLGTTDGYLMSYDLQGVGGFGDIDISLIDGEAPDGLSLNGEDSFDLIPGKSYRFVFSGKGTELRALVFELPEMMNPVVDCLATDTNFASGQAGLLVAAASDADTADGTFDNYSDTFFAAPPSIMVGSTGGGNVTVSWPGNLECIWVLESSPTIGADAVWTEVALANVAFATGQNVYTGPTPMADTGNTFYRLRQL